MSSNDAPGHVCSSCGDGRQGEGEATAIDPVCGMKVKPSSATRLEPPADSQTNADKIFSDYFVRGEGGWISYARNLASGSRIPFRLARTLHEGAMTLSIRSCFETQRLRIASFSRRHLNHLAFAGSFFAVTAGCDDDSNHDEPGPEAGGHGGEIVIIIEPEPHPITGCLYLDRMICESYEPPEGCVCHDNAPAQHELCDEPGDYTCRYVAIVPDALSSEIHYADCSCSEDAPRDPDDCESPVDFRCVNPEDRSGCLCEAGSPESPEDCAQPERFFCQQYEPQRTGCSCEGSTEEECRSQSEHTGIQCVSSDPMFGCWCVYAGP